MAEHGFTGKELTRQRLVDHRDSRRSGAIAFVDQSPFDETHAERRQVLRRRRAVQRIIDAIGRHLPVLDLEPRGVSLAYERQRRDICGALDAWERLHAGQHAVVELQPLLRISVLLKSTS